MKEVKLGDIVHIFADKEYFGKIEEINIRTTTVRTFNLQQVILPNIKLIESPMKTYSSEEIVRLETNVEVDYGVDIAFAIKVFETAINNCNFVQNPKMTECLVDDFADSGIKVRCLFRVNPEC